MNEKSFPPYTDLTGYWSGEYWYENVAGPRTSFAAHISETGGSFDGTTLEADIFDDLPGEISASIAGVRGSSDVSFTKRYDPHPHPDVHEFPIFYAGVVNSDLTVIEGDRSIPAYGHWRGGFHMRRGSTGSKASITRKAKEPVLVSVKSRRGKSGSKPENRDKSRGSSWSDRATLGGIEVRRYVAE